MIAQISGLLLGLERRISKGDNPRPYLLADIYQPELKSRNKVIRVMVNDEECMRAFEYLDNYERVTVECLINVNKGYVNVYANKVVK